MTEVGAIAGACTTSSSPFTTNVISEQASIMANPNITFPSVDPGDNAANAANTIEYTAGQAVVEASIFDIGSVLLKSRSAACDKPFAQYMYYIDACGSHKVVPLSLSHTKM